MRNSAMATRNAAGLPGRPERCTEFQLHGGMLGRNVVDFTEQKLLRYAEKANDPQQKLVLMSMVKEYRSGDIAIAWRKGQPVFVRVTRERLSA